LCRGNVLDSDVALSVEAAGIWIVLISNIDTALLT